MESVWAPQGFTVFVTWLIDPMDGTKQFIERIGEFAVMIGLAIEISLMFLVTGVIFVKMLPPDPKTRILGIPNRWFLATAFSCLCVFVEILLHGTGYFHWAYSFWTTSFPVLIVVFGYLWFFAVAFWVYDMGDDRRRQLRVVGTLAAIDAAALIAFGPILGASWCSAVPTAHLPSIGVSS